MLEKNLTFDTRKFWNREIWTFKLLLFEFITTFLKSLKLESKTINYN